MKHHNKIALIKPKVWDVIDHSCLASIRPKSHKISGELQGCCYNQKTKTLLVNTD